MIENNKQSDLLNDERGGLDSWVAPILLILLVVGVYLVGGKDFLNAVNDKFKSTSGYVTSADTAGNAQAN